MFGQRENFKKQEDAVKVKHNWVSPATSTVGQAETLTGTEKVKK